MKEQLARSKYGILIAIAAIFVALDQWTKHLIDTTIRFGDSRLLLSFFNLTNARNQGAAFNFMQSAPGFFRTPLFALVPLVALAAIAVVLHRIDRRRPWTIVALSLIASGALGNWIDRVRLGYVIDFLDFHWHELYHFPAFNVADSCIVVGVGILLLQSFRQSRENSAVISTP